MYTPREFQDKIDWEGGFVEAVRYGITVDEIPRDLQGLWELLVDAVAEVEAIEGDLQAQLDDLLRNWTDDESD